MVRLGQWSRLRELVDVCSEEPQRDFQQGLHFGWYRVRGYGLGLQVQNGVHVDHDMFLAPLPLRG